MKETSVGMGRWMRAILIGLMAGGITWAAPDAVRAQAAFPNKPIRIVVPYPAGGTSDIQVRAMQEPLQRLLGQPVVIDNKPGASGSLGAQLVANSPADGHTLLFPNNALVITPHISKDAGYALKDFAPVAMVSVSPMVLVVNPALAVNNVGELVSLARREPGRIEYASAGTASFGHLATEMLSRTAGIRMLHVPYKGQAPATLAVMSGEAKVLLTTSSAQMNGYIKDGKLRLLGVASARPTPLAPGAAPISEMVPGIDLEVWFALFAPAGTPKDVVAKLNDAINKVLAMPEVRDRFPAMGVTAAIATPDELGERINKESASWAAAIKDGSIKVD
ncbi:MAG TPA: tripartite tricarboxylate transporter substrate binding protein [Burkholderiaceae bacterium]|nr:tripartite tricarboxylate transporter substrate binding protein [Burkholderiaceae bacterium]